MLKLTTIMDAIFSFNGELTDVHIETEDMDLQLNGIAVLNPKEKAIDIWYHCKPYYTIPIAAIKAISVETSSVFDPINSKLVYGKFLKIVS